MWMLSWRERSQAHVTPVAPRNILQAGACANAPWSRYWRARLRGCSAANGRRATMSSSAQVRAMQPDMRALLLCPGLQYDLRTVRRV